MQQPVLVVKLGTAVLTGSTGTVSKKVMATVAAEIAALSARYKIVLVSSGAVGCGRGYLQAYKGTVTERKAAAAIGNPALIQKYQQAFQRHRIPIAQALCERHHFSNRPQYLQLKDTFATLWENGILPIVNENDIVSNVEIKFSDNDELATLLAIAFDAKALLIATSVGGLLDGDKKIIPFVARIDQRIQQFITPEKSGAGLGGMLSKVTFARLATSLGIRVVFCGMAVAQPLQQALQGSNGTTFAAAASTLKARQRWLAGGSITPGSITVDAGAARALAQRRSLLTIGIQHVQGKFDAGEVVQLLNPDSEIIGVAKTRLSKAAMQEQLATKNILAAHADDIVLF